MWFANLSPNIYQGIKLKGIFCYTGAYKKRMPTVVNIRVLKVNRLVDGDQANITIGKKLWLDLLHTRPEIMCWHGSKYTAPEGFDVKSIQAIILYLPGHLNWVGCILFLPLPPLMAFGLNLRVASSTFTILPWKSLPASKKYKIVLKKHIVSFSTTSKAQIINNFDNFSVNITDNYLIRDYKFANLRLL